MKHITKIRMYLSGIHVALSFYCVGLLHADQFKERAEAQNMLDHRVKHAWATETIPMRISLSGYVKAEGIYDSRQDMTERDGHFLYFPLDHAYDVRGKDINTRGDLDQYALQTRFRIEAFGPSINCFESRSYIEGDFFGTTDATLDAFRMRHAYMALESDRFNFLAGQTWHPMYLPAEAPDTISFNTGVPIQPFALNPQFRIVFHDPHLDVLGALIGWVGDRPFGPLGPSDVYFRDAIIPDIHVQARFKWNDEQNYIGAGIDFMRILPRLVSNLNYKEIHPFNSMAALAYARLCYDKFVLYAKGIYADDAAIWDMIGGYAVHSVDRATDIRTYAPLRTASFWAEIMYEADIEPALFIGYVKNLGAKKTILPTIGAEDTVYGIGTNIKTVFRASPRVRWYINSFVLGAEVEYTRAQYGTLTPKGTVVDTHPLANVRFLFATYYVF